MWPTPGSIGPTFANGHNLGSIIISIYIAAVHDTENGRSIRTVTEIEVLFSTKP